MRMNLKMKTKRSAHQDPQEEDPIVAYELFWIWSIDQIPSVAVLTPHLWEAQAVCFDLKGTTKDYNIRSIRLSEKLSRLAKTQAAAHEHR